MCPSISVGGKWSLARSKSLAFAKTTWSAISQKVQLGMNAGRVVGLALASHVRGRIVLCSFHLDSARMILWNLWPSPLTAKYAPLCFEDDVRYDDRKMLDCLT